MNFIDLFAGAGGLSEGFKRAGFKPVAHVEIDRSACLTLKTRLSYYYLKENGKFSIYENYLKGEINREQLYSFVPPDILKSVINLPISGENNSEIFKIIESLNGNGKIDVLIGGPPCQAYSLVGRAVDGKGMRGDPRNYLYVQYGRYLNKYKPKLFIFENVTGLVSAGKGQHFKNIQKYFKSLGFTVEPLLVNANDYGVLQKRERILIIGWRKKVDISIESLDVNSSNKYTVKSVFSDLPALKAGEGIDKYQSYTCKGNDYLLNSKIRNGNEVLTQHIVRPANAQDQEIYMIAVKRWNESKERLNYNDLPERLKTHKNREAFLDRFKVVADNVLFSHTVMAHIAKDGHYYIHPDIEQNRSISVREAARLQSFPDEYYFEGRLEGHTRTPAFRQIGNAVPPLMATIIAQKIKKML
jgi:DNA (cytosine-5)-methyltransferase 1